jgi:hypothetical protein
MKVIQLAVGGGGLTEASTQRLILLMDDGSVWGATVSSASEIDKIKSANWVRIELPPHTEG